jgi:WD40 repeat protein
MSHVFISYSRRDINFAQKIVDALITHNLDTWIDWKSIPKGEAWEHEIYRGIEAANVFLFLISPDSVRSQICGREILHAVENNKRILPIIIRDTRIEDFPDETAKKAISKRNWVFCRDGQDDFSEAIGQTLKTIQTDYPWLKYHTELQLKALKWDDKKDTSRLLRGKELREAEEQLAQVGSQKDPQPTELQRNYVLVSQRNEVQARRQITIGLGFGLLLVTLLAFFAWTQRNSALSSEATAIAEANAKATALVNEEYARATAQAETIRAEEQAAISRARELAAQSSLLPNELINQKLLLAVEAYKITKKVGYIPSVEQTLRDTLAIQQGNFRGKYEGDIKLISPDGHGLAISGKDNTVHLWNLGRQDDEPFATPRAKNEITRLVFSPKGHWLLIEIKDSAPWIWDVSQPKSDPTPLTGFVGPIYALAFSEDENWLGISGEDKRVYVWSSQSWIDAPKVLETNQEAVITLAFSPNNLWLAIGSDDSTITIRDMQSQRIVWREESRVSRLAFSPDGQWLVAGSFGGSITVWNAKKLANRPLSRGGHARDIIDIRFSPDGRWMVTSSNYAFTTLPQFAMGIGETSHVLLWDSQSWETVLSLDENPDSTIDFSPDGKWLSVGRNDGTIRTWEVNNWQKPAIVLYGFENAVQTLSFDKSNEYLIAASQDGTIRKWDSENWSPGSFLLQRPLGNETGTYSLDFSPDGRWLSTGSIGDTNLLWRTDNWSYRPFAWSKSSVAGNIVFSHSGSLFLVQDGNKIVVWDTAQWRAVAILMLENVTASSYQFSMDDNWVVVGNYEGKIRIWNARNWTPTPTFVKPGAFAEFSPDSRWLMTRASGKTTVWNTSTWKSEHTILATDQAYGQWHFSPGGRWLVVLIDPQNIVLFDTHDWKKKPVVLFENETNSFPPVFSSNEEWLMMDGGETIYLWKLQSPSHQRLTLRYTGNPNFIYFSPDNRWLVIGVYDTTVQVWDMKDLKKSPTFLRGQTSVIHALKFDPDGRWLAVSSQDRSIRIWNAQDWNQTPIILYMEERAQGFDYGPALEFSPTGRWLAATDYTSLTQIWDMDLDVLAALACNLVARNFTPEEWTQYFSGQDYPADQESATCPQWPLITEMSLNPLTP